jgi:hypothetical protein
MLRALSVDALCDFGAKKLLAVRKIYSSRKSCGVSGARQAPLQIPCAELVRGGESGPWVGSSFAVNPSPFTGMLDTCAGAQACGSNRAQLTMSKE